MSDGASHLQERLIQRNVSIPMSIVKDFTTVEDNQECVTFKARHVPYRSMARLMPTQGSHVSPKSCCA